MSTAAAMPGTLEPVAEIKFGQVGIANLKLKRLDPDALLDELRDKVASAEKLFLRAPVVLDLSHLPALPALDVVRDLLERIRSAGMLPVGLSYGTSENERIAVELGIPVIAKFRASYERAGDEAPARPVADPPAREAAPAARADAALQTTAAPPTATGMLHDKPVRSGQQVYARGRDLVLTALVGNGAEVIADGSIHVYGALRGRALAGAQGNEKARIFCRAFHAELVAIAGNYKVLEEIPKELHGKAVQVWLDGGQLRIAALE